MEHHPPPALHWTQTSSWKNTIFYIFYVAWRLIRLSLDRRGGRSSHPSCWGTLRPGTIRVFHAHVIPESGVRGRNQTWSKVVAGKAVKLEVNRWSIVTDGWGRCHQSYVSTSNPWRAERNRRVLLIDLQPDLPVQPVSQQQVDAGVVPAAWAWMSLSGGDSRTLLVFQREMKVESASFRTPATIHAPPRPSAGKYKTLNLEPWTLVGDLNADVLLLRSWEIVFFLIMELLSFFFYRSLGAGSWRRVTGANSTRELFPSRWFLWWQMLYYRGGWGPIIYIYIYIIYIHTLIYIHRL